MGRLTDSTGFWAFMLLTLVCGIGLLILAAWLQPLQQGARAARSGDPEPALEQYNTAVRRFDSLPPLQQILPRAWTAARVNRYRLLYRLGRYDTLLEEAAKAPALAAARFWSGCVLFRRAVNETDADARHAWLERAGEEFRRALVLAPGDWDTKYNLELTERLLARMRQKPEPPPNRLLRPRPGRGQPPSRPLG